MKITGLCKIYFIFLLVFVVSAQQACVSTKNIPPKPEWLINRPISQMDYIGIGSASISSNVNEYQQIAKKNAMNDLAGEISMNISSASFLHKLAVNDVFNESFDTKTQTIINENLEGYQLIGTYEDKSNYWVYYTLSKETYQQIKQERIQKALDNAQSKFRMAMQYKSSFQYYKALILLVKATEEIKPYLAEPLLTKYENKEIYFGNELFNEIFNCFNEIKIAPLQHEVTVKRGQAIETSLLTFIVNDRNGHLLEDIPVVAGFSGGGLIIDKARSNQEGKVGFSIPKVRSKKNTELFTVKIDVAALLQEATNDFIIKKLLGNFKGESATMQTTVLNPVFYIESTCITLGVASNSSGLKDICHEILIAANCEITGNKAEADYILKLNAEIRKMKELNRIYTVGFDIVITVQNTLGKSLYQRNITDITATQNTIESAANEAYNKGKEYLKTRVIPDFLSQLF